MYRLPDGSDTRSQKKYVEAWREFAAPFEAAGFLLHSFDPGISFHSPDHPVDGVVSLPIWAARKLHDALAPQGEAK